jgi:hypothetical protein
MNKKMKVGLIVDGYFVNKQIKDLVDCSLTSDAYEISYLIIQNKMHSQYNSIIGKVLEYFKRRGAKKFIEVALFKTILFLEKIIITRLGKSRSFYSMYDLKGIGIEALVVKVEVSKSGLVYRYNRDDLEKIADQGLELLIRCGGGILRGEILNICPKGIISFHHANNEINRGGPPGFWEVYYKQNSTGFIIQILKDELDGGDVIFKGSIPTSFMYSLNLVNLYTKSNIFMHKILEEMATGQFSLTVYPKKPYAHPLYTIPSVIVQVKYVMSTFCHVARKLLRRILSNKHRWGVAYQYVEHWENVSLRKSKKIRNPPNRYLADPFVWSRDNKHYCFVEDYDYRLGKGCISVYEITENDCQELGVALMEKFHLSYPFIFECEGELYMCPETNENNDVRLYKCVEFPLKWKFEKTLLSNVSAVDTIVFYKDNKWWLLTNICSAGMREYGSELHIFWCDELLSSNWNKHPKNPVIFDSLKARNGGLLYKGKDVYRVCQRQGWDFYGEAFGVSKITKISETSYDEIEQFTVDPFFFENIRGTHTLSFDKGLLAVDYVAIENYKR